MWESALDMIGAIEEAVEKQKIINYIFWRLCFLCPTQKHFCLK